MEEKEYTHFLYGSDTSSLLRLTKPWSGSDRQSVQALHKHSGLRFIGLVKTVQKQFPKARLQRVRNMETTVLCKQLLRDASIWQLAGMVGNEAVYC